MVSSTLNPQAIIGNSQATFESFGNFMTGGNLESSSIVSNSANKIVNFNRPEVAPITPNLSSLISNISTNILNQVDNSVSNVMNVTNGLEDNLKKLKIEFFNRLTKLSKKFDFFQNTFSQKDISRLETQIQTIQNSVSNLEPQVQSTVANPQVNQTTSTVEAQTPVSQFQQIIQNIQGQITNVLDNTIRNFSKDYQQKVKGFDDTRPNNVLTKFLDLYKNAIGFVNFFGDRKNIGVIETNLKALRKIFQESFEVAAILRQTIIKIVKQLSNLPNTSPSSGGLNLDINVPGGRLKQGANAARIGNIARMGGIAGSSLLAAGGIAAAATGMGRAREYQESSLASGVAPATGEQYVPENIVESFSAIVDRFVAAVNSLISGAKSSSGSGAASGGGVSGGGSPSPGGGSGSSSGPVVSSGTAGENLAAFTSTLEASGVQNQADVMQVMINRAAKNHSQYGGLFGQITAREQFSPISAAIYIESADKNAQRIYGPIATKLGNTPKERIETLRRIAEGPQGLENLQKIFGRGSAVEANKVLEDFKSGGALSQISARDIGGGLYFRGRGYNEGGVYFDRGSNKFIGGKGKGPATLSQVSSGTSNITTNSQVTAAPTQTQANQAKANIISQPAQQVPQTISLSPTIIDAGGGGQAQQGSAAPPAIPSQPSGAGPEVPMLSTSNPDNFLTMYSRIVYNIVDG